MSPNNNTKHYPEIMARLEHIWPAGLTFNEITLEPEGTTPEGARGKALALTELVALKLVRKLRMPEEKRQEPPRWKYFHA
jgi:hypothetical protein